MLLLKFIGASLIAPLIALFLWCFALAFPALLVMPVVFVALVVVRWLGFGWGGTIDVDITAEACPLGTTSVTRLSWRRPARKLKKGITTTQQSRRYDRQPSQGLRHCNVYEDRRAPILIARFIRDTLKLS